MKRRALTLLLIMGLCVGTASAQFGFGIVYDPTNYANALLRYAELQQQLVQLKNSYTQLITQYNLLCRCPAICKTCLPVIRRSFHNGETLSPGTRIKTPERG